MLCRAGVLTQNDDGDDDNIYKLSIIANKYIFLSYLINNRKGYFQLCKFWVSPKTNSGTVIVVPVCDSILIIQGASEYVSKTKNAFMQIKGNNFCFMTYENSTKYLFNYLT